MTTRTSCGLLALAVLAPCTALLMAPSAAHAATATCDGIQATITGGPSTYAITGTSSRDVIVTNGSTVVDAGDGNDLICVTSADGRVGGDPATPVLIDAGAGSDTVRVPDDAKGHYADVTQVFLGPGGDTFTGNDGDEFVYGNAPDQPDGDLDRIDTGDGGDYVVVGDGGQLTDQIDVGTGSPVVEIDASSMLAGFSHVTSAPGGRLRFTGDVTGAWWVDAGTGVVKHYDARRFTWTGFTRLEWLSNAALAYTGTSANNVVSAPRLVQAVMGGGNDIIATGPMAGDYVRVFKGGAGLDQMQLLAPRGTGALAIDVPRGVARFGPGNPTAAISGFEQYRLFAGNRAVVKGGGKADDIAASACRKVTIRGGRGNDRLVANPFGSYLLPGPTGCWNARGVTTYVSGGAGNDQIVDGADSGRLLGGAGRDLISGGGGKDTITGGTGRDRADGGAGKDVCRAEVRVRCEKR